MRFNVELTIEEKGLVRVEKGYERNSSMELKDILEWMRSQLILVADQALTEEQAKGFDKKPVILIDGLRNKPVRDVSPFGTIEIIGRQDFGDILLNTYNDIILNSKVKTGLYQSSHQVVWNRTTVATDINSLMAWVKTNPQIAVSDTLMIINSQPYARKLELKGITSKGSSVRKEDKGRRRGIKTGITVVRPNGVYQMAVRKAKTKYRGNVGVFFKFLPGDSLGLSGKFVNGKNAKSKGRAYLYPALIFKIGDGGLF